MSTGSVDVRQLEYIVIAIEAINSFTATKENLFSTMNIYRKAEARRNLMNILITCGYDYVEGSLVKLTEKKDIL